MLPLPRPAFALILGATLALIPAGAATGSSVNDALQPLAVIGNNTRAACNDPAGPLQLSDAKSILAPASGTTASELAGSLSDGTGETFPPATLLASFGFEFAPTVSVCSPTLEAIPPAFSGATAERLNRSQVGRGWRAIGNSIGSPAPLGVGDDLTVPELDDAATLRAAIATPDGTAATRITFTDLAPGPLRLRITQEQRGVVATLSRGDGSTSEQIVAPTSTPPLRAAVRGNRKTWTITSNHLPGSAGALLTFNTGVRVKSNIGNDGRLTTTVRFRRPVTRKRSVFALITINQANLQYTYATCTVTTDRRRRPASIGCTTNLYAAIFGLFFGLLDDDELDAARRSVLPPARSVSARRARSAAVKNPVPLKIRQIQRTDATRERLPFALRPLAADINGDGAPDFWADDDGGLELNEVPFAPAVGTLLVSTPQGLRARTLLQRDGLRDESPTLRSEVSAIDDVTGDGIGELIVDLGERHALIPGRGDWGTSSRPITVPDPTDLGSSDYLLRPSVSSPGAPYAAMDDATGDGRRELAASDDYGTWQSISSALLTPGSALTIGMATRALPTPGALLRARVAADQAPRFDPRGRIISGRYVSLSWPQIATTKSAVGRVTIAVRDAMGAAVTPPATTSVTGNALLLDYDRRSGDVLLLAVPVSCTSYRLRTKCRQTIVRVRADGSIRQTIGLGGTLSATTAPQSARFLPDGPDADSDVEVVLSEDGSELSVASSTLSGLVGRSQLGHAQSVLLTEGRVPYAGVRLYPIAAPDGSRRVFAVVNAAKRAGDESIPVEISW